MSFSDFRATSPWPNLALLVLAAVVVWSAGTRLTNIADEISRRTGLGKAFTGLLLLGTVTSLPEIATTTTAATMGDAALVTSNEKREPGNPRRRRTPLARRSTLKAGKKGSDRIAGCTGPSRVWRWRSSPRAGC